MKCKNAFSPSADDPGIQCGPSMTEQHHQEKCDINNIIQRYTLQGVLPEVINDPGVYTDISDVGDFLSMQLQVLETQQRFMALPAEVRKEFNNDPALWVDSYLQYKNQKQAEPDSKPTTPVKDSPEVGQSSNQQKQN